MSEVIFFTEVGKFPDDFYILNKIHSFYWVDILHFPVPLNKQTKKWMENRKIPKTDLRKKLCDSDELQAWRSA